MSCLRGPGNGQDVDLAVGVSSSSRHPQTGSLISPGNIEMHGVEVPDQHIPECQLGVQSRVFPPIDAALARVFLGLQAHNRGHAQRPQLFEIAAVERA
jgi:hypothetical protein